MNPDYRRIAVGTTEPVTLEQAMLHCRVDGFGLSPAHEDEPLITALIQAARELAEDYTGRALVSSTYEARFDRFGYMPLRGGPVTSVTSVEYIDTDGALQTLATTEWVFDGHPARPAVYPAFDVIPPDTRAEPGAVRITYEAGPTDGSSPNPYPLPRPIYQAMLLAIGYWYDNRDGRDAFAGPSELSPGVRALLGPYRSTIL